MPTVIAPEDGISPAYYTFDTLKKEGFVNTRNHLRTMIAHENFPSPIKRRPTRQAKAVYHGPSVRKWFLDRAQEANYLPKVR